MTYKLLMGKNLYKFNTMKLRFKRRNKKSGQGEKRRERKKFDFYTSRHRNDGK